MVKFDVLHDLVVDWAAQRRIIPNSTPLAQASKTIEEVAELVSAINRQSRAEMCAGFDLLECLSHAYDEIKDRTGHLRPDGVFVKDAP
jgi:hypothetical protein